jgi:hypothetical protein
MRLANGLGAGRDGRSMGWQGVWALQDTFSSPEAGTPAEAESLNGKPCAATGRSSPAFGIDFAEV